MSHTDEENIIRIAGPNDYVDYLMLWKEIAEMLDTINRLKKVAYLKGKKFRNKITPIRLLIMECMIEIEKDMKIAKKKLEESVKNE